MPSTRVLAACMLVLFCTASFAQAPPVRIRGTVERFESGILVVKSRDGGTASVKLGDKVGVSGVVAVPLSELTAGKYIATATLGQKDGALVALEVLIFPEPMRGGNEGHFGWDLKPGSMMTNATISDVAVAAAKDRVLTLRYKDGEKKVLVPDGAPVVTFVPSDTSVLKPGAHVFIYGATRDADGGLSAARVSVGLNGLVPPM